MFRSKCQSACGAGRVCAQVFARTRDEQERTRTKKRPHEQPGAGSKDGCTGRNSPASSLLRRGTNQPKRSCWQVHRQALGWCLLKCRFITPCARQARSVHARLGRAKLERPSVGACACWGYGVGTRATPFSSARWGASLARQPLMKLF